MVKTIYSCIQGGQTGVNASELDGGLIDLVTADIIELNKHQREVIESATNSHLKHHLVIAMCEVNSDDRDVRMMDLEAAQINLERGTINSRQL